MFKRKTTLLILTLIISIAVTGCSAKNISLSEAPLLLTEVPAKEKSTIEKQNTALTIMAKSKKRTAAPTILTPVQLSEQEKDIASMIGEHFFMFMDQNGTASVGIKLYKSGELATDLGYYKAKTTTPDTKLMISSGKLDKMKFNWQLMTISKKESYQESLSAIFNEDSRIFVRKAVMNLEPVEVNTRNESVLGYIAFKEGEAQWDNQGDVLLGAQSTLNVIQGDLKKYQYCYVITAIVK